MEIWEELEKFRELKKEVLKKIKIKLNGYQDEEIEKNIFTDKYIYFEEIDEDDYNGLNKKDQEEYKWSEWDLNYYKQVIHEDDFRIDYEEYVIYQLNLENSIESIYAISVDIINKKNTLMTTDMLQNEKIQEAILSRLDVKRISKIRPKEYSNITFDFSSAVYTKSAYLRINDSDNFNNEIFLGFGDHYIEDNKLLPLKSGEMKYDSKNDKNTCLKIGLENNKGLMSENIFLAIEKYIKDNH